LCLQIVLDLLFVIFGPIGFWFILCYTIGNNLRLKSPIDNGVPHIHIHRLDVNAHAFFPIVVIFSVENRRIIRPILDKTPYELLKGRKPNLSHLRVFGRKCFVLNNGKDKLGKFDAKADDSIFLGYSSNSKTYRIFNKRTLTVEESIHVAFHETPPQEVGKDTFGFDIAEIDTKEIVRDGVQQEAPPKNEDNKDKECEGDLQEDEKQETSPLSPHDWITTIDHPLENVLGDILKVVSASSQVINF